jgi:hypothetical protein
VIHRRDEVIGDFALSDQAQSLFNRLQEFWHGNPDAQVL